MVIDDVSRISAAWLSETLSQAMHAPALRVATVRAEALKLNAAYCAELFRLHIDYAAAIPGAPLTLIAKLPRNNPGMAENARVFQPGTKEAWFYAHAAPDCGVTVPRCFYTGADRASGRASFLFEDLGNLEATPQVVGMGEHDAALALREAARLHARWHNTGASAALAGLRELIGDPDDSENLVDALYAEAWPLFVKHARFAIPPAVSAFGASLIGRGAQIGVLSRSAPRTLIHGDFRVDNLLFQGSGTARRCIVLDWESVDIGCGLSDVGWLLAGCLPRITPEQEQRLLGVYHRALVAGGQSGYTWEACRFDYRRCMVEPFVQGVLSGAIWEPDTVDAQDAAFATAIGSRFVAAAERLALWELL